LTVVSLGVNQGGCDVEVESIELFLLFDMDSLGLTTRQSENGCFSRAVEREVFKESLSRDTPEKLRVA
jgi:hypothetical protein